MKIRKVKEYLVKGNHSFCGADGELLYSHLLYYAGSVDTSRGLFISYDRGGSPRTHTIPFITIEFQLEEEVSEDYKGELDKLTAEFKKYRLDSEVKLEELEEDIIDAKRPSTKDILLASKNSHLIKAIKSLAQAL